MAMLEYISAVLGVLSLSAKTVGSLILLYIVYSILTQERPLKGFPLASIKRKGIHRFLPERLTWISQAQHLLEMGTREFPSCFQVPTLTGYKIIVPRRFADEIKSNPHMDVNKFWAKELCISYPGFEAPRILFSSSTFITNIVKHKLTRSLSLIIPDLLDETSSALQSLWDDPSSSSSVPSSWHLRPSLKSDLQSLVARLTSRIFLGQTLCRDPLWSKVSREYTVTMFIAANQLRIFPEPLRPLAHRLLPACRRIREQVAAARELILPEVERRRRKAEAAIAETGTTGKGEGADAIGWMVEEAAGREVDFVASQLALTVAAVHTTAETVTRAVVQMGMMKPEVVESMRGEVRRVLREYGWSNTSLGQMKLMDSFLKEVQRVHALARAPMKRVVGEEVRLSDGTVLPAGSRIMVFDDGRGDEGVYERPGEFRAERFAELREKGGKESELGFTGTSAEHMTFGYGLHACPGRWFAANEIKILLTFVLMRYDCELVDGKPESWLMDFGDGRYADPKLKIRVRRRKEDFDLLAPKA